MAAGTTGNAVIDLAFNSFEFYDGDTFKMYVVPGEYDLWYGGSSEDKDLKQLKLTID